MKKRIIIIGLLGLALGVWRQPIVSAAEGFVYPANERGNSISTIDVGTGQVKNIVTRITPHDVQVSRDDQLLLAVGPVADMIANQSPMKMTDAARWCEAGF